MPLAVPPIPQPKFHLDQKVWVRNYRLKPARGESGVVTHVEVRATRDTLNAQQRWWVAYTVRLNRVSVATARAGRERPIDLHVQEDDVEAL